jgi:hypothetical protein
VLTWLVETVLKGGSAMIDDVALGRVRPLRRWVTRQIKATIGGTVTTALISPTTILVHSALVIDAKTEDQHHRELQTRCCASAPATQDFHSTNPTGAAAGHKSPQHQVHSPAAPARRGPGVTL